MLTIQRSQKVRKQIAGLEKAGDHAAVVALLRDVPVDDLVGDADLTYALAMACSFTGEYRLGEHVLAVAESRHGWRGEDRSFRLRLNARGLLARDLGRIEESEEIFCRLIEAASCAGDHRRLAYAWNNLGGSQWATGRFAEAANSYRRSRLACTRMGYIKGIGIASANLAMSHRETGLYALAIEEARRAIDHHRRAPSKDMLPTAELELGLLLHLTGDPRFGEAMAERARKEFQHTGRRGSVGEAERVLGIIACDSGRHDEACARLSEALRIARRLERGMLEAEVLEEMAVLEMFRGENGTSDAYAKQAVDAYRAIGMERQAKRLTSRLDVLGNYLPATTPHRGRWWLVQ